MDTETMTANRENKMFKMQTLILRMADRINTYGQLLGEEIDKELLDQAKYYGWISSPKAVRQGLEGTKRTESARDNSLAKYEVEGSIGQEQRVWKQVETTGQWESRKMREVIEDLKQIRTEMLDKVDDEVRQIMAGKPLSWG